SRRVRPDTRAHLSTLGDIASKAAYQGGGEWLTQCVDYIDGNHEFAQKFIASNIPTIKVGQKAQGTYLMWLDMTEVANRIGAKEMAEKAAKTTTGRGGRAPSPKAMVTGWGPETQKAGLTPDGQQGVQPR